MTDIEFFKEIDQFEVTRLVSKILEEEFGFKVSSQTFPDIYKIKEKWMTGDNRFWVAKENNEIIGTVALLKQAKNGGYLKRMFVKKDFRRQGVAKKLYNRLKLHCKKEGIKDIYLTTIPKMKAAMRFYEKNGFLRVSKLPGGWPTYGDHIFYKKDLENK